MMRWLLTKGAWSEQPKFRRWKSIYKTTATYYYELPTSCPGPAEVKGNFVRRQCSCLFSKMLSSTHKSNNDAVKLNFEAHLPLLLFQVHTGISLVSTADISNFHTCVIFTLFLKFLSRIEKRPHMRWPTVYYKSSILFKVGGYMCFCPNFRWHVHWSWSLQPPWWLLPSQCNLWSHTRKHAWRSFSSFEVSFIVTSLRIYCMVALWCIWIFVIFALWPPDLLITCSSQSYIVKTMLLRKMRKVEITCRQPYNNLLPCRVRVKY